MLVKSVTRSILCLAAIASALPQGAPPSTQGADASQLQALGGSHKHKSAPFNTAGAASPQAEGQDSELQGAADGWSPSDDSEDVSEPAAGSGSYGGSPVTPVEPVDQATPTPGYGGTPEIPSSPVEEPPTGGSYEPQEPEQSTDNYNETSSGPYDQPQSYGGSPSTPDEPIDQSPPSYDQPQTYGGGPSDEPIDQPQGYGGAPSPDPYASSFPPSQYGPTGYDGAGYPGGPPPYGGPGPVFSGSPYGGGPQIAGPFPGFPGQLSSLPSINSAQQGGGPLGFLPVPGVLKK